MLPNGTAMSNEGLDAPCSHVYGLYGVLRTVMYGLL